MLSQTDSRPADVKWILAFTSSVSALTRREHFRGLAPAAQYAVVTEFLLQLEAGAFPSAALAASILFEYRGHAV